MARSRRNYLPENPYHVVQRGVNKSRTFFEPSDFDLYLGLWTKFSAQYNLSVHAYCLMPNHIHFLVTPHDENAISVTSRQVGSRYAATINKKYHRTGTLWEGRHWSSLIQSEHYLLRCYRYIELNPVRASICQKPAQYRWSSFRLNSKPTSSWITPHQGYLDLGKNPTVRASSYRTFVDQGISNEETNRITRNFFSNSPTADESFISAVENDNQLRLRRSKRGRPEKSKQW